METGYLVNGKAVRGYQASDLRGYYIWIELLGIVWNGDPGFLFDMDPCVLSPERRYLRFVSLLNFYLYLLNFVRCLL
jgi:hypothetical protein